MSSKRTEYIKPNTEGIIESHIIVEQDFKHSRIDAKNIKYLSMVLTDSVILMDSQHTTDTRKVFKVFTRKHNRLIVNGHIIAVI